MNKNFLGAIPALFALLLCMGCDKNEEDPVSPVIEGLTLDNYPKVDGSTSTAPLNMIIACNLLDVKYRWESWYSNLQEVVPDLNKKNSGKLGERIKSSQTHKSFANLIDGTADLILTARTISSDEKALADAAGVKLIETPIALDAFIFIVNPANTVSSLTREQIQGIYTGEITDWNEVGGEEGEIHPYVRNPNSGSQELMESLVMKDLEIIPLPQSAELMAFTMTGAFEKVDADEQGISYTVYYYKEHIIRSTPALTIAVDGIYPDKTTISNGSYPYVAEVYAVIRDDLDPMSMAYKVYEWLQTDAGSRTIVESGYIPYL